MKNNKLLILILLVTSLAKAQEVKHSFSLKEAINYALEHNRNVKNAELSIQAAKHQKWEATAKGLPQIEGKIDYTNNVKTPIDVSTLPQDSPLRFMFPKHNLTPSVTLSQLVFDGSYIVGLQAAKVFLAISKNAKEKTDNEIKVSIINAYNTTLLTKESIEIMDNNILTIKNNLHETLEIFKNGLTEEENVEQLQLTLSNLENNYKNLKNIYTISKGLMKLLLGIESDQVITLTDNLNDLVSKHTSLELANSNESVFNNLDYKIAINDTKSKRLLYKLEQSRQLPTISTFLSLSRLAYNDNQFTSIFKKEQSWLATTVFGAKITMPIFTSFQGRARRHKAKIDWEISNNNLKETEEKLKLDILKAKSEYVLAIDIYENKQKNLHLAEKIEKKNTIKYKEGLSSSFDLRQAQVQLYSSQQEYLQAMVDVINNKAALENLLNLQ